MLRGDVTKLASACGVSRTTIYRIAGKIDLDLKPIRNRCDKTVDAFSGYALADEQKEWLADAVQDINAYRNAKRKQKIK